MSSRREKRRGGRRKGLKKRPRGRAGRCLLRRGHHAVSDRCPRRAAVFSQDRFPVADDFRDSSSERGKAISPRLSIPVLTTVVFFAVPLLAVLSGLRTAGAAHILAEDETKKRLRRLHGGRRNRLVFQCGEGNRGGRPHDDGGAGPAFSSRHLTGAFSREMNARVSSIS